MLSFPATPNNGLREHSARFNLRTQHVALHRPKCSAICASSVLVLTHFLRLRVVYQNNDAILQAVILLALFGIRSHGDDTLPRLRRATCHAGAAASDEPYNSRIRFLSDAPPALVHIRGGA
jgi:hypothetical protein